MNECLLCKRDMKASKDTFGKGCVRNIYSFLGISMPKKVKLREQTLYKNIMKINNIHKINENQKIWLVDRYLTQQYLNRIPYGNYKKIINQINIEIQNINQIKNNEELKSAKKMSLKQAYDLYKKATKFTKGINKIKEGKFTDEESIKLLTSSFSFIFNINKNKNQYEKDSFKAMQYVFWQTVIEIGGKYAEFDISADFLQHSLEEKPEDLYITKGKVVDEIKKDNQFKEKILQIIEQYGKEKNEFVAKGDDNSISFNNKDLYFSIHSANLIVKGKKYNEEWELDITLEDTYDYSKPKNIGEYYFDTKSIPKSIFSSTLYNLAATSMKLGVMKEYKICINFKINEIEVKQ